MAKHAVMFVHIDDRELPRLLLLMEEIFDERNRIGMIVWKNATDNNPSRIVVEHEYVLCYAMDKEFVAKVWTSRGCRYSRSYAGSVRRASVRAD